MTSRVQAIAGQALGATALTLTLPTAPTAGNLLVFVSYATAAATQSSATVPGFTQDVITNPAVNIGAVVMSKVATGAEGSTHTLTWASATTGTVLGELIEVNAGSGKQWKATGLVAATGSTADGTATATPTVTATGATTGATYAVAVLGIGAASVFANTWTGGFTWDGATTAAGRIRVADKDSTTGETLATTETIDVARVSRMALAAYATETVAGLLPPAGLTATPISSTRIDLSWTAAANATGYDIERGGSVIATGVVSTTYSDTGLSPSTSYSYRVRSTN